MDRRAAFPTQNQYHMAAFSRTMLPHHYHPSVSIETILIFSAVFFFCMAWRRSAVSNRAWRLYVLGSYKSTNEGTNE
jgi:hypothetical protein